MLARFWRGLWPRALLVAAAVPLLVLFRLAGASAQAAVAVVRLLLVGVALLGGLAVRRRRPAAPRWLAAGEVVVADAPASVLRTDGVAKRGRLVATNLRLVFGAQRSPFGRRGEGPIWLEAQAGEMAQVGGEPRRL